MLLCYKPYEETKPYKSHTHTDGLECSHAGSLLSEHFLRLGHSISLWCLGGYECYFSEISVIKKGSFFIPLIL